MKLLLLAIIEFDLSTTYLKIWKYLEDQQPIISLILLSIEKCKKKRKNHCMYGRGRGSVVKILR
jgi:hypothetical protein